MTSLLHKAFSNIKSQTIQEAKAIVNEIFIKMIAKNERTSCSTGKLSNIYKLPR